MAPEGGELAERYLVEELIANDGRRVTLAVRHVLLDERLVMALPSPELAQDDEAADRFEADARFAMHMQSDHVARVIDVGRLNDGTPYAVREYLEGGDLARGAREQGPLDPELAVDC